MKIQIIAQDMVKAFELSENSNLNYAGYIVSLYVCVCVCCVCMCACVLCVCVCECMYMYMCSLKLFLP